MTTINSWDSALGDDVYRNETEPDTGERVVARYRLVVPFWKLDEANLGCRGHRSRAPFDVPKGRATSC